MCGIFAWALKDKCRHNRDLLIKLTDMMSHRGPDGSGYWIGDVAGGTYQIGLGHRRLSIIDLAGGAQPMYSADRSIAVTFNGEIYNYLELRDQLAQGGSRFNTTSDTEVLIEAYRVWGTDAISRLRGMFSFSLWDAVRQVLVVARDPYGKKPLFFTDLAGSWVFSSEIEPLINFPGVDRRLDFDALRDYLLNRYVPGPRTLFKGAKKLPPGCFGLWKNGHLAVTRYFVPPIATTNPDVSNFQDAVQMFSGAFADAVRIRMRSDAPYGAFLSGGLDSSAVVATMVNQSSSRVRTFSIGFQEKEYSELGFARSVAKHFDTDHQEIVVDPDSFMEHWPVAILRRGAPVSEPADIPILILSMLASKTVKMVLTGEGSDELIGGYPKHRAEQWIPLYHRCVPRLVHDYVLSPAIAALPYGMRKAKVVALAAGERDLANRMRVWFGGVSPRQRDMLLQCSPEGAPPDRYPFSIDRGSSVRRTLFFDQTSWLPDNLLERGDRMMMAGSVEGRMPFMDTELASVVARFPDRFLVGKPKGKVVLRAAMEKSLPGEIISRKKVGFRIPVDQWFRGAYREFVREVLTSESTVLNAICHRSVVASLVDAHIGGRTNNEKVLWSLMNLELFLRAFRPSGLDELEDRDAA